jgi:hypothetical protein
METIPITKFCCDCLHLVGVRHNLTATENWKCAHPNNVRLTTNNPVTGLKITVYKNEIILDVRSPYMCGDEGKWFEKYEKPEYSTPIQSEKQIHSAQSAQPTVKDRLKSINVRKNLTADDI